MRPTKPGTYYYNFFPKIVYAPNKFYSKLYFYSSEHNKIEYVEDTEDFSWGGEVLIKEEEQ